MGLRARALSLSLALEEQNVTTLGTASPVTRLVVDCLDTSDSEHTYTILVALLARTPAAAWPSAQASPSCGEERACLPAPPRRLPTT
jgi:hypothetical protein